MKYDGVKLDLNGKVLDENGVMLDERLFAYNSKILN